MIGKFLLWLQEFIKHWIKPATPVLVSSVLSDLSRSRIDLVVENALLRQQLIVLKRQVKRPALINSDRFRLVFLSHFTKFWKQSLHIVQPETLLRWHRELFRIYWRQKSQGKPKVSPETIGLIQKIGKENHLWGSERIRGELLKLGIEVSKRTIQESKIPYRTPCANGICERFIGSLRRECLDHVLFHDGKQVQRVVREYTAYYNRERPHQGIGQRIPNHYDLLKSKPTRGRITSKAILGGLHHSYTRAAFLN
jgi:hypothetical protein